MAFFFSLENHARLNSGVFAESTRGVSKMGGAPRSAAFLDVLWAVYNMARLKNILISFAAAWTIAMLVLSAYLLLSGRYAIVSSSTSSSDAEGNLASAAALRRFHLQSRGSFATSPKGEAFVIDFEDALEKLLDSESKGSWREFEKVVALSSLLPPISNISRIRTPAPDFFLQYIAPVGLPIIFTDMLEGTRLDKWSWEMVRERWGERIYGNTRQGDYSSQVNRFGKHYIGRVSVRLKDFIDVVTGKRAPKSREKGLYITKQRVLPPEQLEELFYYPPFYPGDHKSCYLEPTGW